MAKQNIDNTVWICEHCNIIIKDKSKAWSRKGLHWCSNSCFREDEHWLKSYTRNKIK